MQTLPERIYDVDKEDRHRFLPHGIHPAKMNIALTLDIVRRYTRPGDLIVDPFLGIGGTLTALLEGRNVCGIELEPHHYENAARNARHLEEMARLLGHRPFYALSCGDSREVLAGMRPEYDAAITSPAFGEMNAEHAGGNVTQRPAKNGKGFEGGKEFFTYDRQPAAGVGSPPYADALRDAPNPEAQVERIRRKVAEGKLAHPEGTKTSRRTAWGGGQVRVTTHGYGLAGMGSPPYGDELSRDRSQEPYAQKHPALSREFGRTSPDRSADGYGKSGAQIGNMKLKDGAYQDACAAVYKGLLGVIPPGGVLVLVTGDYVRQNKEGVSEVIDLAAMTILLCEGVGWTPVERWRGRKKRVSFWRGYWAKRGQPLIDYEDVLVFANGQPAYAFTELPPTGVEDEPEQAALF